MTYEQYQQIYNLAKTQIEDRVNKLQPRAGNNASVNGMGISIEVPMEGEGEAEEEWLVTLRARVEGQYNEVGPGEQGAFNPITKQYETQFTTVATIPRVGDWVSGGDATGSNQSLIRSESPPFPEYYREFRLFLESSSTEEEFKIPLTIGVTMFYRNSDTGESKELETFTFDVGYAGADRYFVAPRLGTVFEYYTLNLTSIERTA